MLLCTSNRCVTVSSREWGTFENNVNLNIGRRSLVGDEYFDGTIDEVKIYRRALTEDEVRWSYLRGYPEKVKRPKGSLFVEDFGQELFVTGERYRLHFKKEVSIFTFEIKGENGKWYNVNAKAPPFEFEFAYIKSENWDINSTYGLLCTFRHVVLEDRVVVGMNMAINPDDVAAILSLHFICVEEGVLIRFAIEKRREGKAHCWSMPRLLLIPEFDEYLYWDSDDKLHAELFENLGGQYAGVFPEQKGDLSKSLSEMHPAFLVWSQEFGVGLGTVYLNYSSDWKSSQMFIQRCAPTELWFYPGISPISSDKLETWAWLAPFSYDTERVAEKVERFLILGKELKSDFSQIAADFPEEFLKPVPDFPKELRRETPVEDISEAIVYTLNHTIHSPYAMELVKKVGSDVLVRGWFKGGNAPDYTKDAKFVQQAHRLGTLFGGGATCSQLWYGKDNLTEEELLDMATRGTNGELVGGTVVHGTLSNPKYVDYILSWCYKQIDAGVDYLFMDEHTAEHSLMEGYDDYSLRDFRIYLKETYCNKQRWKENDIRFQEEFKIDMKDTDMCPDGTINSFNYRVYLQKFGFTKVPWSSDNLLAKEWWKFKNERDDRAWKKMTDELRAYALNKGRRVFISANGMAKYVDIQVQNMGMESVKKYEGQLDLSENWIDKWNLIVRKGWDVAGHKVPVVFFHDFGGSGDAPIFAWMELSPSEKNLWIRARGAEIYASGGFFAFPIFGPFGCDAMRDGTIREIAKQTEFYQRNKQLYLQAEFISSIKTMPPFLSVALWRREKPPALLLHIINRETVQGKLKKQTNVAVDLPFAQLPKKITVFSPDWEGTKSGKAQKKGKCVSIEIPELEAYAVVVLSYERLPEDFKYQKTLHP